MSTADTENLAEAVANAADALDIAKADERHACLRLHCGLAEYPSVRDAEELNVQRCEYELDKALRRWRESRRAAAVGAGAERGGEVQP